ncbi:MAG: AIR synthase-related protein [Eisenbergiella sp.]
MAFDRYRSIIPEAAVAGKSGVWAMTDVTEGGIFGALWEMAESSGVGLEIDLKKLPIRQETVEICNFLDWNPYELISGGSLLIAAENGADLVRKLEAEKIPAAVVGRTTRGKDRIVKNGEEKRFLEPAKPDELYQL